MTAGTETAELDGHLKRLHLAYTRGAYHALIERAEKENWSFHAFLIALTVATSLVGVVMWGTLSGSTLPFLHNALGLDPASASAPFVATLVDLFGLVIYFSAAQIILRGTLL